MSSREELWKIGVENGLALQNLKRMPIYVLEKTIQKIQEQKSPKSPNTSNKSNKSNLTHLSNKSFVELDQQQQQHNVIDDNCTVVDMSAKANSNNFIDELYKSFKQEIKKRNTIMHAIKTNSNVFQNNRDQLDEEDSFKMQQELNNYQDMLQLVLNTMEDYQNQFVRIQSEKRSFYKQYRSNLIDITGDLYTHFDKKLENIHKYMEDIELQKNNFEC